MASHWTLPLIQARLDELTAGAKFAITRDEMISLFGLNSAAVGRINRFADGHRCEVIFTPAELVFRKVGDLRTAAPRRAESGSDPVEAGEPPA